LGGGLATPVPDKLTVAVLALALWLMPSVAVIAPADIGVSRTGTVQLLPTARGAFTAQLLPPTAMAKLPPVTVMALNTRGAVPTLVTVTSRSPENEPTLTEPKVSEAGVISILGSNTTGVVAVPETPKLLTPPVALCVTVIVASRAPATLGVNPTDTLQLDPAAMLPQLLTIEKSGLLLLTPLTISAAVPVLRIAKICDARLAPTTVEAKASDAGDSSADGEPVAALGFAM